MAAPLLKTPNPKKNNDIRKQNNFMSIIETKSKDENKPNPKSQSVLQDYNIKYEKKSSEPVSKKTDVENTKVKPLNKFIEQINYRTEQHYKTDEKYFR